MFKRRVDFLKCATYILLLAATELNGHYATTSPSGEISTADRTDYIHRAKRHMHFVTRRGRKHGNDDSSSSDGNGAGTSTVGWSGEASKPGVSTGISTSSASSQGTYSYSETAGNYRPAESPAGTLFDNGQGSGAVFGSGSYGASGGPVLGGPAESESYGGYSPGNYAPNAEGQGWSGGSNAGWNTGANTQGYRGRHEGWRDSSSGSSAYDGGAGSIGEGAAFNASAGYSVNGRASGSAGMIGQDSRVYSRKYTDDHSSSNFYETGTYNVIVTGANGSQRVQAGSWSGSRPHINVQVNLGRENANGATVSVGQFEGPGTNSRHDNSIISRQPNSQNSFQDGGRVPNPQDFQSNWAVESSIPRPPMFDESMQGQPNVQGNILTVGAGFPGPTNFQANLPGSGLNQRPPNVQGNLPQGASVPRPNFQGGSFSKPANTQISSPPMPGLPGSFGNNQNAKLPRPSGSVSNEPGIIPGMPRPSTPNINFPNPSGNSMTNSPRPPSFQATSGSISGSASPFLRPNTGFSSSHPVAYLPGGRVPSGGRFNTAEQQADGTFVGASGAEGWSESMGPNFQQRPEYATGEGTLGFPRPQGVSESFPTGGSNIPRPPGTFGGTSSGSQSSIPRPPRPPNQPGVGQSGVFENLPGPSIGGGSFSSSQPVGSSSNRPSGGGVQNFPRPPGFSGSPPSSSSVGSIPIIFRPPAMGANVPSNYGTLPTEPRPPKLPGLSESGPSFFIGEGGNQNFPRPPGFSGSPPSSSSAGSIPVLPRPPAIGASFPSNSGNFPNEPRPPKLPGSTESGPSFPTGGGFSSAGGALPDFPRPPGMSGGLPSSSGSLPSLPHFPGPPSLPGMSGNLPGVSGLPRPPGISGNLPGVSGLPRPPGMSGNLPGIPGLPRPPGMSGNLPGVPGLPRPPGMSGNIPGLPGGLPGTTGSMNANGPGFSGVGIPGPHQHMMQMIHHKAEIAKAVLATAGSVINSANNGASGTAGSLGGAAGSLGTGGVQGGSGPGGGGLSGGILGGGVPAGAGSAGPSVLGGGGLGSGALGGGGLGGGGLGSSVLGGGLGGGGLSGFGLG